MRTQIADGDVCHGLALPIHVPLPRLFCCPSVTDPKEQFSLNFELNLMVTFENEPAGGGDGVTVSQNVKLLVVPMAPLRRREGA